jgi:tryptophan synthase alpha chain
MTSRISERFAALKTAGRGGLVTYVTAGDPNREISIQILVALAHAGADLLEVGVPFSDPLADGPVIQRASERALAAGMTLRGTLDVVREVRRQVDTPIVLFTYANPVVRMDAAAFAGAARDAGVDGVLILDYPVEESDTLRQIMMNAGLDPIFLIGPTTSDERIQKSAALGRGFLYVISRLGVTGARAELSLDAANIVQRIRRHSDLPVVVGFGISRPEHVADTCRSADAAVVGSALVSIIAEYGTNRAAERAGDYVRWLKSAL